MKFYKVFVYTVLITITINAMSFSERIEQIEKTNKKIKKENKKITIKEDGLLYKLKRLTKILRHSCFNCFQKRKKFKNKVYPTNNNNNDNNKSKETKTPPFEFFSVRDCKLKTSNIILIKEKTPGCIKQDSLDDIKHRKSVKFHIKSNSEIFDLNKNNLSIPVSPIVRPYKDEDDVVYMINDKIKGLTFELQKAKSILNNKTHSIEKAEINIKINELNERIATYRFLKKEYLSKVCSLEEHNLNIRKSNEKLIIEKEDELQSIYETYDHYFSSDKIDLLSELVHYIIYYENQTKHLNTVCFSLKRLLNKVLNKVLKEESFKSNTQNLDNPNDITYSESKPNNNIKQKIEMIKTEYTAAYNNLKENDKILKELKDSVKYSKGMEKVVDKIKKNNTIQPFKEQMIKIKENHINEKFNKLNAMNVSKLKMVKNSVFSLKNEFKERIGSLPRLESCGSKDSLFCD